MKIITQAQFFDITASFEIVPYTQTQGWFTYFYTDEKERFVFLVDDETNPQMACFAHVKQALGVKMLMLDGACMRYKNFTASLVKSFYEGLSGLSYDMVEVVSNEPYNSEFEIGIRRAGFLRPVGAFSMPLSNWINLQETLHFNSNWTRNLKKAEAFPLRFELQLNPSDKLVEEIVAFYNQFTREKGFTHSLAVNSVKRLLKSVDFGLGLVYNAETLVSFIIFHQSKNHAGLLYAAKRNEAKESAATFFMYKNLFDALKEKGVHTFDMEKLVPSNHSTDGVFLFKDGIKGERVIYNGEWSWYKRALYRPLMYFVKRWLFKKREI